MNDTANNDPLIRPLRRLFERMAAETPEATRAVSSSRLIIRLKLHTPEAEILINGRRHPAQVSYGPTSTRADLDIDLPADGLHKILLRELSLKQALVSGQMRVRGPIFKTFALEELFHRGQALYPEVLRELDQQDALPGAPE